MENSLALELSSVGNVTIVLWYQEAYHPEAWKTFMFCSFYNCIWTVRAQRKRGASMLPDLFEQQTKRTRGLAAGARVETWCADCSFLVSVSLLVPLHNWNCFRVCLSWPGSHCKMPQTIYHSSLRLRVCPPWKPACCHFSWPSCCEPGFLGSVWGPELDLTYALPSLSPEPWLQPSKYIYFQMKMYNNSFFEYVSTA